MVTLFNSTLDIGRIIESTTSNVTGNLGMTLLLIVVLFLVIGLLFRAPILLLGLIMIPMFTVFATYEGWGGLFYTILTVFGLVIAWQFAKIFMGWGR